MTTYSHITTLIILIVYMISTYSLVGWKYTNYSRFSSRNQHLLDIIHSIIVVTNISFYFVFAYILNSPASNPMAKTTGFTLFTIGVLLILWSIRELGTAVFFQKHGSEIIQRGPYRYIRHPIYSGGITGAIGLCLVTGSLLLFIYTIVLIIMLKIIATKEEAELHKRFGIKFREYTEKAGMFLPRRRMHN